MLQKWQINHYLMSPENTIKDKLIKPAVIIPIAEPFRTIIYVLSVVIMVLIVLYIISILLSMAGISVSGFHALR